MKKVSLVLPCYNEEKNVAKMLELCKNTLLSDFSYQYIFINDGSKDNTFLDFNPSNGGHVHKNQLSRYISLLLKILCQVSIT